MNPVAAVSTYYGRRDVTLVTSCGLHGDGRHESARRRTTAAAAVSGDDAVTTTTQCNHCPSRQWWLVVSSWDRSYGDDGRRRNASRWQSTTWYGAGTGTAPVNVTVGAYYGRHRRSAWVAGWPVRASSVRLLLSRSTVVGPSPPETAASASASWRSLVRRRRTSVAAVTQLW